MSAPLTEAAIKRMRVMIASGDLVPGSKLPPEADLARQLGTSRNTVREAVRALVTARVLDVRRGDGSYVTSLRPELLLEGIGFAAELLQDAFSIELIEVRRILEPAAAAMAARRIDLATLSTLDDLMGRMREHQTVEELVRLDADFHALVSTAAGNETLASMLNGISAPTMQTRVWRAITTGDDNRTAVAQHQAILDALAEGDPALAEAAALVHVAATEASLRQLAAVGSLAEADLADELDEPGGLSDLVGSR